MKMNTISRLKQSSVFVAMILFTLLVGMNLNAAEVQKLDKSFKGVELVKIATVSGDCKVKAANIKDIKVHLEHNHSSDYYTPSMTLEGNILILKEEFKKNENKKINTNKKHSTWTVTVPANTKIKFASASGDFKAEGVSAGVYSKTASGDVKLIGIKGNVEIKAASGDIKIEDANADIIAKTASGDFKLKDITGTIKVNTASGDIEAEGMTLTGTSEFTVVSGEIELKLAKSLKHDLSLKAVSGDIELNFNGNPVKGHFMFKGMKGDISSDIPFDKDEGSKHSPVAKKSFTIGGDSPKVTLKTVSGNLSLKK